MSFPHFFFPIYQLLIFIILLKKNNQPQPNTQTHSSVRARRISVVCALLFLEKRKVRGQTMANTWMPPREMVCIPVSGRNCACKGMTWVPKHRSVSASPQQPGSVIPHCLWWKGQQWRTFPMRRDLPPPSHASALSHPKVSFPSWGELKILSQLFTISKRLQGCRTVLQFPTLRRIYTVTVERGYEPQHRGGLWGHIREKGRWNSI